jgi:hypothetical protein
VHRRLSPARTPLADRPVAAGLLICDLEFGARTVAIVDGAAGTGPVRIGSDRDIDLPPQPNRPWFVDVNLPLDLTFPDTGR